MTRQSKTSVSVLVLAGGCSRVPALRVRRTPSVPEPRAQTIGPRGSCSPGPSATSDGFPPRARQPFSRSEAPRRLAPTPLTIV
jgi:hypothetical protein